MDNIYRKALRIIAAVLLTALCFAVLCSCSLIYSPTPNEGEDLNNMLDEFFPEKTEANTAYETINGHEKNNYTYPSNDLYYYKLSYDDAETYRSFRVLFNEKYPDDTERSNNKYYNFDDPIIVRGPYELHIKDLRGLGSYYPSQFLPVIGFNDDNKEILFLYYYDGGASFESVENLFEKEGGLFPKPELIFGE